MEGKVISHASGKQMTNWYGERNRDSICGPISDVANFLAELCEDSFKFRSLNSYCSFILTTHNMLIATPRVFERGIQLKTTPTKIFHYMGYVYCHEELYLKGRESLPTS